MSTLTVPAAAQLRRELAADFLEGARDRAAPVIERLSAIERDESGDEVARAFVTALDGAEELVDGAFAELDRLSDGDSDGPELGERRQELAVDLARREVALQDAAEQLEHSLLAGVEARTVEAHVDVDALREAIALASAGLAQAAASVAASQDFKVAVAPRSRRSVLAAAAGSPRGVLRA